MSPAQTSLSLLRRGGEGRRAEPEAEAGAEQPSLPGRHTQVLALLVNQRNHLSQIRPEQMALWQWGRQRAKPLKSQPKGAGRPPVVLAPRTRSRGHLRRTIQRMSQGEERKTSPVQVAPLASLTTAYPTSTLTLPLTLPLTLTLTSTSPHQPQPTGTWPPPFNRKCGRKYWITGLRQASRQKARRTSMTTTFAVAEPLPHS